MGVMVHGRSDTQPELSQDGIRAEFAVDNTGD